MYVCMYADLHDVHTHTRMVFAFVVLLSAHPSVLLISFKGQAIVAIERKRRAYLTRETHLLIKGLYPHTRKENACNFLPRTSINGPTFGDDSRPILWSLSLIAGARCRTGAAMRVYIYASHSFIPSQNIGLPWVLNSFFICYLCLHPKDEICSSTLPFHPLKPID